LIIAHSGWVTNGNFIIVVRVATGNIISARIYATGSYNTYSRDVKSILISSGSTPKAYVLSNIKKLNDIEAALIS
jgi:hypothetical protein